MGLLLNPLMIATLAGMMCVTWTFTAGYSADRVPWNTETTDSRNSCPQMELLRGRDGIPGRDGRDGGKGDVGPVGATGPHGVKGDRGEVGPTGATGEKGDVGREGRNGVPGPQGPAGISGPQGVVGEKGDRGHPGLPGPQGEQGAQGPPAGGAVYTRWGRTSCPSGQGTELLYSGRAGGTSWEHKGGAANILCLPNDPQYSQYGSGVTGASPLTGVKYKVYSGQPFDSVGHHNMPCAVCYTSSRVTVSMIPAKVICPTHWTTEYTGYIMADRYTHNYTLINTGRSLYECIDQLPESVPGQDTNDFNNVFLYHVEATCNSLSCPPYDARKEVTCVVCTR